MLPINVTLSYYKRQDIQDAIVSCAKDREVAARFNEHFSKRPDVLRNSADILELAKQGATSFHVSEEIWKNPLQLDPSLKRHEMDRLRIGWDLVLDIDCMLFEYSKIAADLVIKALRFHNVSAISCKFSGNKGFHIGVPFESFPEKINGKSVNEMFPETPRRIAFYIKEMIKKELGSKILEHEDGSLGKILEKTGKKQEEVVYREGTQRHLNSEPFLTIDTVLLASRHLYRMPYSLHEKSALASVPINPADVLGFDKKDAIPSNVKISKFRFLDPGVSKENDAKQLIAESFDFAARTIDVASDKKEFDAPLDAIPEEFFPPCIKIIMQGIDDGKKRALFLLVNYFTAIGWSYESIEKKLREWNAKNKEQLREILLLSQLKYHKQMKKKILPPNCKNEMYMLGMGVCRPDSFCARIKNPAQYSKFKALMVNQQNSSKRGKKKEKSKS